MVLPELARGRRCPVRTLPSVGLVGEARLGPEQGSSRPFPQEGSHHKDHPGMPER